MLLVFCQNKTERLTYIFNFLLKEINGFELRITESKEEYKQWNEASLNYSDERIKTSEVYYKPEALLFELNIQQQVTTIEKTKDGANLYFGKLVKKEFDPFAAAFFILSRYEEYLPYSADKHGRFEASSSVLYAEALIGIPLINVWARHVKNTIKHAFPFIKSESTKFSATISIDIDQAYAFKYRGFIRNSIALLRNVFNLNAGFLRNQLQTLFTMSGDPYDSFDYLRKKQEESGIPFIYFINVGEYSKYDKNVPLSNPAMKQLIKNIQRHTVIGLHPSYYSDISTTTLKEKKELEEVLGQKVLMSRQHYLKLNMPSTYHTLIDAGIEVDYSMGYASQPGFRAGTCTPFNWFDLTMNLVRPLKVYPITYMEGNFFDYLHLSPLQARKVSGEFIDCVKQYDGHFLSIWHNNTVSGKLTWKGWKDVFEDSLNVIKSLSCVESKA